MMYLILFLIATFTLWYFLGRVIITLLCSGFNFEAFKEEWQYAGILEQFCAIIWPCILGMCIIEAIKRKYN